MIKLYDLAVVVMPVMLAKVAVLAVVAMLEAVMPPVPARVAMTKGCRCQIDGRRRDVDRRRRSKLDNHIDAGKCRCCHEQAGYCDDSQDAFHGSSPVSPGLARNRG